MAMHKWISADKLINEWENQEIIDPFIWNKFGSEPDEFDNVPAVIPKFLFYLQARLKPVVDYCKELRDEQSLPELREQMLGLNTESKKNLEATDERLMAEINRINEKCQDLQNQIDQTNKERKEEHQKTQKLSMEKLLCNDGLGLLQDRKGKSEGRQTPAGRITPGPEGERKNASALDNNKAGEEGKDSEYTADSE